MPSFHKTVVLSIKARRRSMTRERAAAVVGPAIGTTSNGLLFIEFSSKTKAIRNDASTSSTSRRYTSPTTSKSRDYAYGRILSIKIETRVSNTYATFGGESENEYASVGKWENSFPTIA